MIEWAAGIVDGEGCILAYETPKGCALRLTVRMVHRPTIERLARLFGGRATRIKRSPPCRTVWQWMRSGQDAADVLRRIVPYMCTKYEEAHTLLTLATEQRVRGNRKAPRVWQRTHIRAMKRLKRREWK